MGWESLHYALTHVATGMPFLQRMQRLFQVAATQQQDSCALVKIRCERGAYIAKQLGFSDSVADGIHSLDEHWNGRGYPDGLRKEEIPLFSRIANLSQTLDVFLTAHGPAAAVEAVRKRSGRWFDPELVKAAVSLAKHGALWNGLDDPRPARQSCMRSSPNSAASPPRSHRSTNLRGVRGSDRREIAIHLSPFHRRGRGRRGDWRSGLA